MTARPSLTETPPSLMPGRLGVEHIPGPWFVVQTRSRSEKVFAWQMYRQRVDYFLPLMERVTYDRGRKRIFDVPAFPGYVFVAGEWEARYAARATNHAVQVIDVVDQAKFVRELSNVHKALLVNSEVDLYPGIVEGARVAVRSGPFMGVEGVVVHKPSGKARLVLQVSLLGQSVAMDIDPALVEPLKE